MAEREIKYWIDGILEAAKTDDADLDVILEIDNLCTTSVISFTREYCVILRRLQEDPRMDKWQNLYAILQACRNHFFTNYTRELMSAGVIVRKDMGGQAILAEPDVAKNIEGIELPPSQVVQVMNPVHLRLQRKLAARQKARQDAHMAKIMAKK